MRGLRRNCRPLWYSLPGEKTPRIDAWGNETGEFDVAFTPPVKLLANVSAASGEAAAQAFGGFTDYSRTICLSTAGPLRVGARIWFGEEPPAPHNYELVKDADGLNGHLYALREVVVAG